MNRDAGVTQTGAKFDAQVVSQSCVEFSEWVDAFLARRSMLAASLFPEKPAQMYFGYEVVQGIMERLTEWLSARIDPVALAAKLRIARSPANGVIVTGSRWFYLFALLGKTLAGETWSASTAVDVLGYWQAVFDAYTATCLPPQTLGIGGGDTRFQLRILDDTAAGKLAAQLDLTAAPHVQPTIAVAAAYSWLVEAESRQGTFSHGCYDTPAGTVVVREFANLAAVHYPWVDQVFGLPDGPVAIAIGLNDVTASFDAFGVPRFVPESYSDHVTGAAIVTDAGIVDDPGRWLQDLRTAVARAHRALFRTVTAWERRARFIAGARTHVEQWRPFVRIAGGTAEDEATLVAEPYATGMGDLLDRHLADERDPPIWSWLARTDRPTVFAPVIERLS